MADTSPRLLPLDEDKEPVALQPSAASGDAGRKPTSSPPDPKLSPIAKRAWSLVSEAVQRRDTLNEDARERYLSAEAAGVGKQQLCQYQDEEFRLRFMWSTLIDSFRMHCNLEPSLRPLEYELARKVAEKILLFRKRSFYNRYSMIFERINGRGTLGYQSIPDPYDNDLADYWRPAYMAILKERQYREIPARFAQILPSTLFQMACDHLGINPKRCFDEIRDFVRQGRFSSDILSLVKRKQLDLLWRQITVDIREFPFIFYPHEIEHTKRLMIANTLSRILSRWCNYTSPVDYKETRQYHEDASMLNATDGVGGMAARKRIAESIAKSISASDLKDRRKLFADLLSKELVIVKAALNTAKFEAGWMQKSAEGCTLLTVELKMMLDLIYGDERVEISQFSMYGEQSFPLVDCVGGTPAHWKQERYKL
ncbi:hypothetical protein H113_01387 [Trichophyton rubrum MR1459]|uniref:Uncharacterized protein n=3 Tax=Trichophyton rubrum TaxID=5551 RepID=A0A178F7C2_TRIRU|nr:uncharacterized protein TERG_07031 [Trichophyton rubrum CBS 118892]EZF26513.1 hypothetical protein H100_01379 [Trichophyton rubrum MR850]EZF45491.1 hypothetical protein H102_01374 [Trichophyton rubrum CBS 100081]EZF56138.1 hypothetical protein H103_01384 [Trichophyton rubrum CBS 288.86]EZF66831.1 hypothetical protein H104_01364 [Trichophyton rubrum CBS 289.86]EZF88081.1 hypothetical protein H110_01382 [Trichophyton rubrum MR1448]EZF98825.1 hypothetical protein H113_01387 [Trichophyton rubr